jgi:5-methylcytosine-specific restriction endonuclease McrA
MAINLRLRKLVMLRDQSCWHCGTEANLVLHHRSNRGSGGSKLLDRASNLIAICSEFNVSMESYLPDAREARNRGIKISRYDIPSQVPIKRFDSREFVLDDFGKVFELTEPF